VSLSLPAGASNTPRTVLEHIKGEEVTQRLTEALELDPGCTYRVIVQIEDEALANTTSLPELAKLLSTRAVQRADPRATDRPPRWRRLSATSSTRMSSSVFPAVLRIHARSGRHQGLENRVLLRSDSTLSELARVLERPKFDRYLTRYERAIFLQRFIQDAVPANAPPRSWRAAT
jgi:hypothetical protein